MSDYRLYCIRDGHFFRCEQFAAEDDTAAIEQAVALRGREAAELWSRARMVHAFQKAEVKSDAAA